MLMPLVKRESSEMVMEEDARTPSMRMDSSVMEQRSVQKIVKDAKSRVIARTHVGVRSSTMTSRPPPLMLTLSMVPPSPFTQNTHLAEPKFSQAVGPLTASRLTLDLGRGTQQGSLAGQQCPPLLLFLLLQGRTPKSSVHFAPQHRACHQSNPHPRHLQNVAKNNFSQHVLFVAIC